MCDEANRRNCEVENPLSVYVGALCIIFHLLYMLEIFHKEKRERIPWEPSG